MKNSSKSSANVAIKWAAIYVVTAIVLTYLWQFLGVDPNSGVKFIGYIPFIAFLLLTQKEFKDQLGGFMTYGQAFVSGLLYSVFAGVMLGIFLYLYLGILSPQVMEQTIAAQHDKLVQQGLSEEQMDKANEITKKYGALIAAVASVFVTPVMGAIVALIGGAIFKKEPSLLDIEQRNAPPAEPVE